MDNDLPVVFFHPKNIRCGEARVIYSAERAGWVLPGGTRTTDEAYATRVARNMDRLMRENAVMRQCPVPQWYE